MLFSSLPYHIWITLRVFTIYYSECFWVLTLFCTGLTSHDVLCVSLFDGRLYWLEMTFVQ